METSSSKKISRTHLQETSLEERKTLFSKESYIKGFIYRVKSRIRKPIDILKTLHENLSVPSEALDGRTPYAVFQSWLLDAIGFGLVASVVYSIFAGISWNSLTYIFGFGFGLWLICESIRRIKEVVS